MISVLNKISRHHNSCEDSVYVEETEDRVFGAVLDGCSTGVNSHWASQTFVYIVKTAMKQVSKLTTTTSLYIMRTKMNSLATLLHLSDAHLLSTIILFVYDKKTKVLDVLPLGDCTISINHAFIHRIDQGNKPDYFGYLLYSDLKTFDNFVERNPPWVFHNVESFAICSDGIDQIVTPQFPKTDISHLNPIDMLIKTAPGSKFYLQQCWNKLKAAGFQLNDDLSIVSYATITQS